MANFIKRITNRFKKNDEKEEQENSDKMKRDMCWKAIQSGVCPHVCEKCAWKTKSNVVEISDVTNAVLYVSSKEENKKNENKSTDLLKRICSGGTITIQDLGTAADNTEATNYLTEGKTRKQDIVRSIRVGLAYLVVWICSGLNFAAFQEGNEVAGITFAILSLSYVFILPKRYKDE